MTNVVIACSGGCSSSVFASKMNDFIQQKGLDLSVKALDRTALENELETTDVLLLTPQIAYLKNKFKKIHENKELKIDTISPLYFGQCKVDKVVDQVLSMKAA